MASARNTILDRRGGANGDKSDLKIAILLPTSPGLRQIRRAAELASALLTAETGYEVSVTVGLPEHDERRWRYAEQQVRRRAPSVIVRHLEWTRISVKNAQRMFSNLPVSLDIEGITEICVPRDWGWNFQDCDLWISMADPGIGAILPRRPITHYCGELVQRYVPTSVTGSIHDPYWDLETEAFRIWRQGLAVTSDERTAADLVSYAGVRRERIELIPDVLDGLPDIPAVLPGQRNPFLLVWLVRGNAVDDLENCVDGLSTYHREGGQFEVLIAHEASAPVDHHLGVATLAPDLLQFYKDLKRLPYRSLTQLERMLACAGAVWSSAVAGGEGEHVHDAARAGLPFVGPRFALNDHLTERLGVAAWLYPLEDPLAIADSLFDLESQLQSEPLPTTSKQELDDIGNRAAWGFLIDRMIEHSYVD